MSLFNELKRRNVFRVAIAYIVAAWLVMQFADVVLNNVDAPGWVFHSILLLLGIGLLFAIFFAWAFELTPEGIKKEKDVDRTQSITHHTGRKLDFIIIAVLVVALGYFTYDKFVLSTDRDAALVEATTQAVTDQGRANVEDTSGPDKSIAVLPFVNMSSDEEQEYFSDGLSEELLNMLAKIPELRVAARTSSFSLKGKDLQIAEVGEILKVAHVLEGSVRKSGNQIRITTQLIKVSDGYHMWSETYNRTLDNVFTVQDEIAAEVVAQLRVTLLGTTQDVRIVDPQAYSLYLQARHMWRQGTLQSMEQAIQFANQAIAIDSGFAEPWVLLGYVFRAQGNLGKIPLAEAHELFRSSVNRALAIDPDSPYAHAAVGNMFLSIDNDRSLAATHYERALQLDPGNVDILSSAASYWSSLGRTDRAISLYEYIIERDPVNPNGHSALAEAYNVVGRLDDSLASYRTALAISPESAGAHFSVGVALLLKGEFDDALAEFEQEQGDEEFRIKGLAMALYSLGRLGEFEREFNVLRERWGGQWPSEIAHVYAWVGDTDSAFEWLERAIEINEDGLNTQFQRPFYASLHADPRWQAFRERTGTADAQLAAIEFNVTLPGEASR